MANPAPNVSVNVTAVGPNPSTSASTGTWFVLGQAHGPSGVAVRVNSMTDFNTYFGQIVNGSLTGRYVTVNSGTTTDSSLLYDALDVYFREGGQTALISRVVSSTATAAATAASKFTVTAAGGGTWANSSSASAVGLILTISAVTGPVYTAVITLNGSTVASSPALYSDLDVVNWINSLGAVGALCTAVYNSGGTTALPSVGSSAAIYLTGGTDGANVADTDTDPALAVFTDVFGPGQISYPGKTSAATYSKLSIHAKTFNRVAFLDAVDGAGSDNSSTLATNVATLQSTSNVDPSYAGMFAPWLVVPGITSYNGTSSVFSRTVAPSALAAALVASSDATNDCNVPAAGVGNGNSNYAINVTTNYSSASRAVLNNAGVNVVRFVPNANQIALYGFRSCALDPNWNRLNNVRFRMQVVRDFDLIGEQFIFNEIDGKGQIFSTFAGVLAAQCQAYWLRKSIYGNRPSDSYQVNAGSGINTPNTIAAGQVNASVNLRMSPFGEFVTINVTKYAANAVFPSY